MANREFISPEGLRIDGRRAREVRKIECQLGIFSRVDGSAYYEQGNTKVVSSVYGPREAKLRSDSLHDRADINVEFTSASFSASERRKYSKQDRRAVEIALMIRQTLEAVILTQLFPKSQINVFIQVLQADGGVYAAAINATTLALMNAGIPMNTFLCATSVGFVDSTPVLDLNHAERASGSPEMLTAIDPLSERVLLLQMDNRLPLVNFSELLALAVEGSKLIYRTLKQSVKQYSFTLKST